MGKHVGNERDRWSVEGVGENAIRLRVTHGRRETTHVARPGARTRRGVCANKNRNVAAAAWRSRYMKIDVGRRWTTVCGIVLIKR